MEVNISKYVDFTLLKADADVSKYKDLCSKAVEKGYFSVCVPPYMIKEVKNLIKGSSVKITTVIGFPLGYATTEAKVSEILDAIKCGADEVDVVINVSAIKSGNLAYIENELKNLRTASKGKVLKIIIETCYLTPEEIATVSKMVSESGADFVKTSTGFGPYGARLEDIEIIKKSIKPETKIKASGGVKTYDQALEYINAGVSRIGTSSAF